MNAGPGCSRPGSVGTSPPSAPTMADRRFLTSQLVNRRSRVRESSTPRRRSRSTGSPRSLRTCSWPRWLRSLSSTRHASGSSPPAVFLEKMPRAGTPCATSRYPTCSVIRARGHQPRSTPRRQSFRHGALAVRFYAGYPIESPDGQRVGLLCIMDSQPRQFTTTDAAILRSRALQVQQSVWDAEPPQQTEGKKNPGRLTLQNAAHPGFSAQSAWQAGRISR
jgi:hypothetical protein